MEAIIGDVRNKPGKDVPTTSRYLFHNSAVQSSLSQHNQVLREAKRGSRWGRSRWRALKCRCWSSHCEFCLTLPSVVFQTDTLNLLYSVLACVHDSWSSLYYIMPDLNRFWYCEYHFFSERPQLLGQTWKMMHVCLTMENWNETKGKSYALAFYNARSNATSI